MQNIASSHLPPDTVYVLVDKRLFEAKLSSFGIQRQIAILIDFKRRLAKGKSDCLRVGSRGNNEVIFKLLALAVKDQINPGVNTCIPDLAIGGDIGSPFFWILAPEIVDLAGELVSSCYLGVGIGPYQLHGNYSGRFRFTGLMKHRLPGYFILRLGFAQGKNSLGCGKKQAVA